MQVKISEILELQRRRREINSVPLQDIDFIDEYGNLINIDFQIIEDFKFTGLNNIDFIDTGFYLEGFKKE